MHRFVYHGLRARRGYWREIAQATGVSLRTIEKIARREIVDPGVSHVEKLHAYFVYDEGLQKRAVLRSQLQQQAEAQQGR